MDDLKEFLQSEFQKIHDEFGRMDARLNNVEYTSRSISSRLSTIEHELKDLKRIVRESAQDILENQVEEVARHNLHEEKFRTLEATAFRIDKSVLELKRRVEKLEKANEQ